MNDLKMAEVTDLSAECISRAVGFAQDCMPEHK
jgi:hypothetical protein